MSTDLFKLENLPDVIFADPDPEASLARMVADYEKDTGEKLHPTDPEMLLLRSVAYEVAVLAGKINFTGRQNLPKYAKGNFADHIASFFQVSRLAAMPATTIQRFWREEGTTAAIGISAGRRVSPDGQLFFALDASIAIPAGVAYADGAATCLTPGAAGNGFLPGQVNILVDPVPGVATTENISITQGGAEVENDERLLERSVLVPEEASTAGPEGAYRSITLGVNQLIVDVAVVSPEPCFIEVYPLLAGGELPDAALLAQVSAALSPRDVRPQGDRVSVLSPVAKDYSISGTYYVTSDMRGQIDSINAAVAEAGAAYTLWQKSALGRDINPDVLKNLLLAAGVKRSEIDQPVFAVVEEQEVAIATGVNLVFGGFEDA